MEYWVLAYYKFTEVQDPQALVQEHKKLFETLDVSCRIYISEEGINGQACFAKNDAPIYMDFLRSKKGFETIEFKIHTYETHAFPKVSVKLRPLVAMGEKADYKNTGVHLSAKEWDEMIENKDENTILIDTRNDYEWKIGHFDKSELPELQTFKDFPKYADELKEKVDPEKVKVMMCCTGGIRCELYSALMKEKGFKNVYQLDGGIIKYGQSPNNKHWRGKLFVFDDRLVVPISKEDQETISTCQFCGVPSDTYYNCANMDCNDFIISCPECIQKMQGCCSHDCVEHGRVRPMSEPTEHPKPFRKLSKKVKQQICEQKS